MSDGRLSVAAPGKGGLRVLDLGGGKAAPGTIGAAGSSSQVVAVDSRTTSR